MSQGAHATRIYGIDLLRFLSVVAIVHFHSHETLFFIDYPFFSAREALYSWFEPYSRALAFSGFTVVALSSFFLGRAVFRESRWVAVLLLMWLGCFCLASLEADEQHWFFFEWDIYQFLLLSFSVIYVAQKYPKLLYALGILGAVGLCLPLWTWAEHWPLSGLWRDATFGNCAELIHGKGGWPLLPWMGLPTMFFALGRGVRESRRLQRGLSDGHPNERVGWPILLLATTPWLGGYYHVTIGPGFNCFMHRQAPPVFWSHILWVIFFARLSLLQAVNARLARAAPLRWISELEWSRHFGTCYALHFLWLEVGFRLRPVFILHPRALDLFFISILPVTEVMSRVFYFGLRRLREFTRRPAAPLSETRYENGPP